MTGKLLAAAAAVAIALCGGTAQAQSWNRTHQRYGQSVVPTIGCSGFAQAAPETYGRRAGSHGRSAMCNSNVIMDWYGGEWADANNRSWEPTSYNDWWHEEPARAYPARMRRNQDCQRQWYSGDTLRC